MEDGRERPFILHPLSSIFNPVSPLHLVTLSSCHLVILSPRGVYRDQLSDSVGDDLFLAGFQRVGRDVDAALVGKRHRDPWFGFPELLS